MLRCGSLTRHRARLCQSGALGCLLVAFRNSTILGFLIKDFMILRLKGLQKSAKKNCHGFFKHIAGSLNAFLRQLHLQWSMVRCLLLFSPWTELCNPWTLYQSRTRTWLLVERNPGLFADKGAQGTFIVFWGPAFQKTWQEDSRCAAEVQATENVRCVARNFWEPLTQIFGFGVALYGFGVAQPASRIAAMVCPVRLAGDLVRDLREAAREVQCHDLDPRTTEDNVPRLAERAHEGSMLITFDNFLIIFAVRISTRPV